MRAAVILLILLAVVAAGGVAFFANRLVTPEQGALPVADVRTGPEVLISVVDVAAGDTVGRGGLGWQPWPKGALRGDVISVSPGEGVDLEAAKQDAVKPFEGMTARRAILAGEAMTLGKVFKRDGAAFMPGALRPAMRAVSVEVEAQSGAGGFILPGDYVDVIVAHDLSKSLPREMAAMAPEAGLARLAAETVVADVRVLAIDQTIHQATGDGVSVVGKTVTLEVTPQQAAAVALARQMGDVSLALRSLGDRGVLALDQRGVTDMGISPTLANAINLGLQERDGGNASESTGAQTGAEPSWTVRINRGGEVEQVQGR